MWGRGRVLFLDFNREVEPHIDETHPSQPEFSNTLPRGAPTAKAAAQEARSIVHTPTMASSKRKHLLAAPSSDDAGDKGTETAAKPRGRGRGSTAQHKAWPGGWRALKEYGR